MSRRVPAIMIAGTHSGAGKTTVTAGIVGALARRGLKVQPFKVGPDYIDPSYHTRLAGRPCRNLDSWMVPPDRLAELYARAVRDADVAVVEGVMGLFDGHPDRAASSSAELAKLLGIPVLLVINVESMGQSAAAIAYGYSRMDPALQVAGVIANRVGSQGHLKLVADAIAGATGLPVVGHLPRRDDLLLPERHLGLVPEAEGRVDGGFFERLVGQVAVTVDLTRLLDLCSRTKTAPHPNPLPAGERGSTSLNTKTGLFPVETIDPFTSIAVARDEAFCFYYEDNLDLLRAWGARLVPFSPLHDEALPDGVAGVYLGGGFPELFAAELAANDAMLTSLREHHRRGMPVYAECGGLMYLCQTLGDLAGGTHAVAGLVPANARMGGRRLTLGYVEVRARHDTPVLRAGEVARGHEFHYSALDAPLDGPDAAFDLVSPEIRHGYREGSLLASYVHLHFASNPAIAPNFVRACARWGGMA